MIRAFLQSCITVHTRSKYLEENCRASLIKHATVEVVPGTRVNA